MIERHEGGLDLSPPAAFLAALLLALALAALVGGPPLPFWARLTGPALVLAGMALHRAATLRLRDAATTVEPERLPSSLVVDGPFGRTRNPMYLAGTIILVGVALAVGDYASMMVPPLWAAAAGTWFIAEEERTLGLLFGSEYHGYRERVRRWI